MLPKARVSYIVEESRDPRPYYVPLKAGYYERMEELEPGYLKCVFSKQASKDSNPHLFLQESDDYIQQHVETRSMLVSLAKRERRPLEVSGKMRRQSDSRETRRRKKNRLSPSGPDKSQSW